MSDNTERLHARSLGSAPPLWTGHSSPLMVIAVREVGLLVHRESRAPGIATVVACSRGDQLLDEEGRSWAT
jgi:hypothetical protein